MSGTLDGHGADVLGLRPHHSWVSVIIQASLYRLTSVLLLLPSPLEIPSPHRRIEGTVAATSSALPHSICFGLPDIFLLHTELPETM